MTENKFERGKIYKVSSPNTDKIYIGSTIQTLQQRLTGLLNSKSTSCYKKLKPFGDLKIELIENYPCNSKEELVARESYWIEQYRDWCVNMNNPHTNKSTKEYYIEYNLNQPYCLCMCGCSGKENNIRRHRSSDKHKIFHELYPEVEEQYIRLTDDVVCNMKGDPIVF
jgi:hypothetical protein